MNYKTDTKKGMYTLQAPEKYSSTRPPAYKSSWEQHIFAFLDRNPYVIKWGYEALPIYYTHPFYQKMTVYYPDIWCHMKSPAGNEYKMLIEIKPRKYRGLPQKPSEPVRPVVVTPDNIQKFNKAFLRYQKSLKRFECDMRDYAVNASKWQAAEAWCARNGVIWKILDEQSGRDFFNSGAI